MSVSNTQNVARDGSNNLLAYTEQHIQQINYCMFFFFQYIYTATFKALSASSWLLATQVVDECHYMQIYFTPI